MKFGPLVAIVLYLYTTPSTFASSIEEASEELLKQEYDVGALDGFTAAAVCLQNSNDQPRCHCEFNLEVASDHIKALIKELDRLTSHESPLTIRTRLSIRSTGNRLRELNQRLIRFIDNIKTKSNKSKSIQWENAYKEFMEDYLSILRDLKKSQHDQLQSREQRRQILIEKVTEAVQAGALLESLQVQFLDTKQQHLNDLRALEDEKAKVESQLKKSISLLTKTRKEHEDLKSLNQELESIAWNSAASFDLQKKQQDEEWDKKNQEKIQEFEACKADLESALDELRSQIQVSQCQFQEQKRLQDEALARGESAIMAMQTRFTDTEAQCRAQSIRTEIKFSGDEGFSAANSFRLNIQKMLLNKHYSSLRSSSRNSSENDDHHLLGHTIEVTILQVRLKKGIRYRTQNWHEILFALHVSVTSLGYLSPTSEFPGALALIVNEDGGIESGSTTDQLFSKIGSFFETTVATQRREALEVLKSQGYGLWEQGFQTQILAYRQQASGSPSTPQALEAYATTTNATPSCPPYAQAQILYPNPSNASTDSSYRSPSLSSDAPSHRSDSDAKQPPL